jgi:hypothetical protein
MENPSDDGSSPVFQEWSEYPEFGTPSPLEWFFGPRARVPPSFAHAPFPWAELPSFRWREEYLDSLDDIPAQPGVYVLAHEFDSRALYVGQSRDLGSRIHRDRHRKIRQLIRLYESAMAGYHDRGNPAGEIRVFYKLVEQPYPAFSLQQMLVWCESVSIGLLCPLAQGNTAELEAQSIQLGRDFF